QTETCSTDDSRDGAGAAGGSGSTLSSTAPWRSRVPVERRSLGGAGFLGSGGAAQHVRYGHGDDGAGDGPNQVDPPGGQVPDGEVGAEAAGGVHRGAVVGAAHGAP